MENILAIIFIFLVLSYALSYLFEKLRLPKLLGSLFAGLILGLPIVRYFLIDQNVEFVISTFAEVGIVFLMFYVGLSLDVSKFNRKDKSYLISVSIGSLVLGFMLAFFFSYLVFGFNLISSLVMGLALSVTSESVSANVLSKKNMLDTGISRYIMGAGVIIDIVGVIALGIMATLLKPGSAMFGSGFIAMIFKFILFFVLVYACKFIFIPISLKIAENQKKSSDLFLASIMIALFLASIGALLGLDTVVGALLGGMLVRYILINKRNRSSNHQLSKIVEMVESITFGYFALFFFIYVGMQANFGILIEKTTLSLSILLIAMIGSIFGPLIVSGLFFRKPLRGLLIGVGLSSRDAMGLVIATIAYTSGLVSLDIFNILIFMSFVTTVLTPLFFEFLIERHKTGIKKNKI